MILKKEPNNRDALASFAKVKEQLKEQVQKEIEISKNLVKGYKSQSIPKKTKSVKILDEKDGNSRKKTKSFHGKKLNTDSDEMDKNMRTYTPNKQDVNQRKGIIKNIINPYSTEGNDTHFFNRFGTESPNTNSAFGSESDGEFFPETFDLMKKNFDKNAVVAYGKHRKFNIAWEDRPEFELYSRKHKGGAMNTFCVVILDLFTSFIFGERIDSQIYY